MLAGAQLDHVEADDATAAAYRPQEPGDVVPEQPARLGCARGGHERGVEHVQVDRDVAVLPQPRHYRVDPARGFGNLVRPEHACLREAPAFVGVHAADADLDDRAELAHPGHDAGVVERAALVGVPQVRMGVELQHAQIRIARGVSLDGTDCDRVLAADGDDELLPLKEARDPLAHGGNHGLRRTVFGDGLGGENTPAVDLASGLDVEELHVGRGREDGRRAFIGALQPRGGLVIGHRQNHNPCKFFICKFDGDRTEIRHQAFRLTRRIG